MNKIFNCDCCGECCRHVNFIDELKELDRGDGTCIHLKNNLCSIYDARPDICNVDKMFELVYKKIMTKEEFYQVNIEACQLLKQEYFNK